jgi:prepilin-type N-terminal cleavage/methylation domain-containing protein
MHIAMRHSKSGFTLIELLVVVTIIGILAGLAVPGLSAALKQAKKAQAGTMISNLKVALNAYQADYGAWPTFMTSTGADKAAFSSYGTDGTTLYHMLIGDVNYTDAGNPRGTVYMEFQKKELTNGGGEPFSGSNTSEATGFMDPWRSPYWIKVDGDYDNQIDGLPSKSSGTETVNTTIAIWSVGAQTVVPQTSDGMSGTRREFITSW